MLLEVEDLSIEFNVSQGIIKAVAEANLEINDGEVVGLVGESGSGKTVFAKSLVGIVDQSGYISNGSIQWKGKELTDVSEADWDSIRGEISIIFQNATESLNPSLTVGEQIAETIRVHHDCGEPISLPAEIKRKILGASKDSKSWRQAIELLEAVDISAPENRVSSHPHELSAGMRQRVAIAIALSTNPDLLIADEPTSSLDVTTQSIILDELKRLREEFQMSLLLITHDLAIASEICDSINVMYAGEIVENGRKTDLFENPQHPYTQNLISSIPRLENPNTDMSFIEGSVPNLWELPQGCNFAPRCPEATSECTKINPELRSVGEGESHNAACIYRGVDRET